MRNDVLFALGKPCFYLAVMDDSTFENLFMQLNDAYRTATIRKLRGKKSRSGPEFFAEIGAALQFPYYFGENSAALNDCITDMEWNRADAYLLMVPDASLLLSDAREDSFEHLMGILASANVEWLEPNKYGDRGRAPTPFHVLLQCGEGQLSQVSSRLQHAGIEFRQVELEVRGRPVDE